MYLEQLKTATPQANGQSDLRHLFAFQPQATRHLLAFTQAVMRDVGPLQPGECELIAAMTSKDNHCLFWTGSHAAVAAAYLGQDVVDRVLRSMERDVSELSERERAFYQLVRANTAPEDDRRCMVAEVANVLTVAEIYHANSVIALFNFYNTFVDLNGVDELTDAGYRASGVRLSTMGYSPPATPAAV